MTKEEIQRRIAEAIARIDADRKRRDQFVLVNDNGHMYYAEKKEWYGRGKPS